MLLEHDHKFSVLEWPPQEIEVNQIEHLREVLEWEIPLMDVSMILLNLCLQNCLNSLCQSVSDELSGE